MNNVLWHPHHKHSFKQSTVWSYQTNPYLSLYISTEWMKWKSQRCPLRMAQLPVINQNKLHNDGYHEQNPMSLQVSNHKHPFTCSTLLSYQRNPYPSLYITSGKAQLKPFQNSSEMQGQNEAELSWWLRPVHFTVWQTQVLPMASKCVTLFPTATNANR